jgi:polyisoprenoid-binding protein YceI
MRRVLKGIAAMTALACAALMAAELHVGPPPGSTVAATFKQMGVAVETPFTRFGGRINFDPQDLAAASAMIEVETASLDFGDPAYNAEVAKKAWFDSASYPKAVFRSTAIKALGANKLEATGTLTIKGKGQTITVPVTVGTGPTGNSFDGSFTISRKHFGIGDASWDGLLEDEVIVKFHLQGNRQAGAGAR